MVTWWTGVAGSALTLLLCSCTTPRAPTAPDAEADVGPAGDPVSLATTVTLNQLDVSLDDVDHNNSSWGEAIVDFDGAGGLLYFNLAVDGGWRIQNLPVLSREGLVAQSAGFRFDLGVAEGTDVTQAQVGWDLTATPLATAPTPPGATSIGSRVYAINTGTAGKTILYAPPAPNLVGGAGDGPKAGHQNFPNQQAGVNECVPAALSNSLMWMNDKYGLGLAAADISIASLKGTVGWGPGGAGQQWWSKKRSKFKDKIETTTIPRFSIDKVAEGVANGCDIELRANNHVVSVTGIQKLADGKYSMDLTNDTDQTDNTKGTGKEGTETVTWDPKKKQFSGAPWIEGHSADLIVMECPKQRT
jgi:hypothetical protein